MLAMSVRMFFIAIVVFAVVAVAFLDCNRLTRTEGNRRATPRHRGRERERLSPTARIAPFLRVTQIDIEHILSIEDIRQLLEQSEQIGSVRASDLAEIAELLRARRSSSRTRFSASSTSARSRSSSSLPTPRPSSR